MSGEVRSVEPRKKQKRQGEWERESVCLFCVARESQSVREGRREGGRKGGKRWREMVTGSRKGMETK